jgi:hypothetical protein
VIIQNGVPYDGTSQSQYVLSSITPHQLYNLTHSWSLQCACCLCHVSDYKNKGSLKQDELRRRREEQQVEIRRQKREENISKRRNLLPVSSGADSDEEVAGGSWDPPVCL